ncbi:MAG: M2 family metallopeptidase [Bacillaceae bacterium]|nr:M2 family metallopeptidase [Bacillaceae bacterium]
MHYQEINKFLEEQNHSIEVLYKPILFHHWMSATTGEKEWAEKHEKSLSDYYAHFADSTALQKVNTFREDESINPIQKRQLDDLFNKMVKSQLDNSMREETLKLEKEISHVFNTFRPKMDGKEVSNNDILAILKKSRDEEERKNAWLASKQVGKEIETNLLELVKKRNRDAKELGFDNYFEMCLSTQEVNSKELVTLFKELKFLSDEPFRLVKNEIDEEIANKLNIRQEDIRPWHYVDPFFQEAPPVKGVDLDKFYKDKDLEDIACRTFDAMGIDVKDILNKSDLYPRDKKNPFGFCTNIDRSGDVRILVNLDESVFWATALLHELGHASYFKYINTELPFLLRFHSHTLTTEAIALFFGRMTKTLEWQKQFLSLKEEDMVEEIPAIKKMLQRQMLVSARWMVTFTLFEKEIYENPLQDLNKKWWELVNEIQFVHPPEDTSYPDWAAKMHFSLAPVSYQDYLLGELTASQLQHFIQNNISADLFTPQVGKFLKEQFFHYGASLHWNDKIKKATGEFLNPSYFVKEFL